MKGNITFWLLAFLCTHIIISLDEEVIEEKVQALRDQLMADIEKQEQNDSKK